MIELCVQNFYPQKQTHGITVNKRKLKIRLLRHCSLSYSCTLNCSCIYSVYLISAFVARGFKNVTTLF